MAKSSKLEEYWRQHGIESLFKELTHILVQRMPTDPAMTIVEHLQKKYPQSFKTSTDRNQNVAIVSKTMASQLQMQSINSPISNVNSDIHLRDRSFNQSQLSGIVPLQTTGSAFRDVLKREVNRTKQTPPLNLRQIVAANLVSQQAVKLGKDVQTDGEILEEELIKPSKTSEELQPSTDGLLIDSVSVETSNTPVREEPSISQLIKYKQHIHNENYRRVHREKLAELAKNQREKDHIPEPTEAEEQQTSKAELIISEKTVDNNNDKGNDIKSKEEEEVLDDENVFQPRRRRFRHRQRDRADQTKSNTLYGAARRFHNHGLTARRAEMPMMQFSVCKKCGCMMNNMGNPSVIIPQQEAVVPTVVHPPQAPPSSRSVKVTDQAIDDWFESASEVNGPREVSPWTPDNVIEQTTNKLRRNLFQPINDANEQKSTANIFSPPINRKKNQRTSTPRMSETEVFSRTSENKLRRSSSTQSIPSPVLKKQQAHAIQAKNRPSPSKPLLGYASTHAERRPSGWGTTEYHFDDSDEN